MKKHKDKTDKKRQRDKIKMKKQKTNKKRQ